MEKFFFGVKEEGKGGAVGDRILSISNLLIPRRSHPKARALPYIKRKKKKTFLHWNDFRFTEELQNQ